MPSLYFIKMDPFDLSTLYVGVAGEYIVRYVRFSLIADVLPLGICRFVSQDIFWAIQLNGEDYV